MPKCHCYSGESSHCGDCDAEYIMVSPKALHQRELLIEKWVAQAAEDTVNIFKGSMSGNIDEETAREAVEYMREQIFMLMRNQRKEDDGKKARRRHRI